MYPQALVLEPSHDATKVAVAILEQQYVVAALAETIALMREIDTVIDSRGRWPIG